MQTQPDWTDIVVKSPRRYAETVQAVASLFTNTGLYVEDYHDLEQQVWQIAHVDLIEPELLERPRDVVAVHLYIPASQPAAPLVEGLRARLDAAGVAYTVDTAGIRQQDWANEWKRHYHTAEVGRRLAVVPSWERYDGPRTALRLDPGMAFGTGTHETTLLCLEALDEWVQGGETVLDVGTGSGILGIAAALLGARRVLGIDIDPVAVDTARQNAAENGLDDRFEVRAGDLAAGVGGQYDIITANIVAAAIIELAPALPPLLAPGGRVLASGIIGERQAEVEAALRGAGFGRIEARTKRDWVLLVASR